MEKTSLPLKLSHDGIDYQGWATPSDKVHSNGYASSYHVVLNETFFGDMSCNEGTWVISEQRPHDLILAVGKALGAVIKEQLASRPSKGPGIQRYA